jgi:DNA-binding transcriptional ArsR family regulator
MSPDPARVFAALGDPVRLALLADLAGGARSISALADGKPITRQAVTKHLKVLEAAGMLVSERAGREVRWRGRPDGLAAARRHLDRVAARWDAALTRLKTQLEAG